MRPTSLLVLSLLLHAYVGLRVGPALPTPAALAVALGLAVLAALVPAGLMARRLARHPASFRLEAVGLTAMGLSSSLFVLTLLRDAGLLAVWLAAFAVRDLDTGALARISAAAVPLLALALTVLGFANARRTARVKTVEVPITGLPAALEGFTIAQISDLHVGPTIRAGNVAAIVAAVNALGADVIAVTGDLVDGSVPQLREHVAPLAGLRAPHGCYFVTGNHEYYAGAGPWLAEVRCLGLQVLLNEHVVIARGGATLVLAGVPDYMAHHFDASHQSDPVQALRGAPADAAVRVLLAHQPRSSTAAAVAGFDLQLSGHTHGGQFLPWGFFVRFQQPFTFGLHRVGRMWVYVSRGTGYWGPPKRIGAPSEITRLRLVRADG